MNDDYQRIENEAILLAEEWLNDARALLTFKEKRFHRRLKKMLRRENDKYFLNRMIDRSFRPESKRRVAKLIADMLVRYGPPSFLSFHEKLLARLYIGFGQYIPFISVPMIVNRIMKESGTVILPDDPEKLRFHLEKRASERARMNLNHLGEAILGESQARLHLEMYLNDLKNREIEAISVKISTIYSQILPIANESAVQIVKSRLEKLYSESLKHKFYKEDGSRVQKFVNLDMESFQDLHITADAFMAALSEDDLKHCHAGIALQAYLPDSFDVQKKLTEWAKKRVADGGSPVRIRLVKGANLEMEKLESSIRNWPAATYDTKTAVDACFKKMVEFGLRPENIEAVHIGLGSHNLFDLAWASLLAKKRQISSGFGIEMLEGMADHLKRAIMKEVDDLLLYAPLADKSQFTSAIAYLVRRLDENTGPENFLRYVSGLKPNSDEWNYLKNQFKKSLQLIDKTNNVTFRRQNRLTEKPVHRGTLHEGRFVNEPDTDWSTAANRSWSEQIRKEWNNGKSSGIIPIVVSGEEIRDERSVYHCIDRTKAADPNNPPVVAEYLAANERDIEKAVSTAAHDPDGWREKTIDQRHEILSKVAEELRMTRGDLLGAAAVGTGKVFTETDVEVSEAIDFAEYYPYSLKEVSTLKNLKFRGKGVGLVISPWNFPVAIPCGGIIAALSAGNNVIFKPASAAVLPAWHLCKAFWRAGVTKNVLQFLPCKGDRAGSYLAQHKDIDFIIFTGGTETGISILQKRPDSYFAGETGGKNATIVTASADRDQAIKNIIHSAFSNTGQKCSATSLLILEKEVYDNVEFKNQLVDAAASLKTGSPWNFENRVGPLILPPSGDLKRAIEELEPDEEWALKPVNRENNPYLWSPGIKWNVSPGSYTHMTEFFGPVLAVMRARNLTDAIGIANQTGYGLTAGLESLDEAEQELWKETIRAGNLYINRGTTGAVVLRQPFGGIGKSSIGCGMKAGGPNYVMQFMKIQDADYPVSGPTKIATPLLSLINEWDLLMKTGKLPVDTKEIMKVIAAVKSYHYAFESFFSGEKDYFHLRGQENILRYRPVGHIVIRVALEDSISEILMRIAAAQVSGCTFNISIPPDLAGDEIAFLESREGRRFSGDATIIRQEDPSLQPLIADHGFRIRYAAPERVPESIYRSAASTGSYIAATPVLMEGRVELLQYLREQSICNDYHRYGNLAERSDLFRD